MQLPRPRISGRLIKRYKRFLADIALDDGTTITAHTPNTGSMLGLAIPGNRVWLHDTQNPNRKYLHSWDLVATPEHTLVGIHTGYANQLVHEAIVNGVIEELAGYQSCKPEMKTPLVPGTRFDFQLSDPQKADCYVEVKNVTALGEQETAIFPDAATARGVKHLHALQYLVTQGRRAVLCFCVQREDVRRVKPAVQIDAEYAEALKRAAENGVEILAYQAKMSTDEIVLSRSLPVILD